MKRTGSSMRRSATLAARLPAFAALLEARAAGGHERVLGGDEDGVPQHEAEDEQEPERVAHRAQRADAVRRGAPGCVIVVLVEMSGAPPAGARGLGRWSSSKATAQYRSPLRPSTARRARPTATSRSRCASVSASAKRRAPSSRSAGEQLERDLVGRPRPRVQQGGALVEALRVVRAELARAPGRILHGRPVARAERRGARAARRAPATRGRRRADRARRRGRGRSPARSTASRWSPATSTPSRSRQTWPSAWPGVATTRQPGHLARRAARRARRSG